MQEIKSTIPCTARAAVFEAVGKPLSLRKFPMPALHRGEALVRIVCATLCGSDLHTYYGRRPAPTPSVLGHEMIAEIAALGSSDMKAYDGTPLAAGDRITWSMVWSCGDCYYCRRRLRPKCERLQKFGHERITEERALFGALAEYCHLPGGTAIFHVPAELPDAVACPANCATATVAAVYRNAGSFEGKSIVVLGAGMLGLTACAMGATSGAAQVICLEPDDRRRSLAEAFGATAILDSSLPADEVRHAIRDLTAGRGADIALDFAGHPEALELGLELLREGGRFVVAGATFPARPIQLSGEMLVKRLLQIVGVYNYEPEDLGRAIDFLSAAHRCFPFAKLVTRSFPLDEVNAAFDHAERERPPRVAVTMYAT
jgi:alcohol dehydrogenase